MTVVVDRLADHGWRYGASCHLAADSLEELHAFARSIGCLPRWFQDHPRHPHYDLTAGRRARALAAGAREVSARELLTVSRLAKPPLQRRLPEVRLEQAGGTAENGSEPMNQTQIEIPTFITCETLTNNYRHRCGKPAVKVIIPFGNGNRYEPKCSQHVGAIKRQRYGSELERLADFTPEIIALLTDEHERQLANAKARAAAAAIDAAEKLAARKVRRAAEAARPFAVIRDDEPGRSDFTNWRNSAPAYLPAKPRWFVRPEGADTRTWDDLEVMVERAEGFPTTLSLRASSQIDLNQAKSLVDALTLAIEEAER